MNAHFHHFIFVPHWHVLRLGGVGPWFAFHGGHGGSALGFCLFVGVFALVGFLLGRGASK